jgi:hypothetical protein
VLADVDACSDALLGELVLAAATAVGQPHGSEGRIEGNPEIFVMVEIWVGGK